MTGEEDTIIRMWAEGFTTTKIGEVLGISRSATCGRMHRMRKRGVDLREPKAKAPNGRTRQSHEPAPMPRDPRVAPPDAEAVNPVGVSVMELQPWHCRSVMPRGAEDELPIYCGAEKRKGSSYCAGHHQLYHTVRQAQTPA